MELEEGKTEFLSVRKFMSQIAVREEIAASTGKIIRKFKGKDWDQLAQAMLDACVIDRAARRTSGKARRACTLRSTSPRTVFIDTIEGQPVQSQRKPIVLMARWAICASDIQMYINKTMLQMLSVKAVASMLGALGGKSIRVRRPEVQRTGPVGAAVGSVRSR